MALLKTAPGFIGVISDTHGLLRPEALAALAGASHIIHGGDIGAPAILAQLATIAPVTAVRGNNDHGAWADRIPQTAAIPWDETLIYALHDLNELDLEAGAAGVSVIVSGHSHQPSVRVRDGVLYLNPGSAGPRRFKLPVTLARLRREKGEPVAELVKLLDP